MFRIQFIYQTSTSWAPLPAEYALWATFNVQTKYKDYLKYPYLHGENLKLVVYINNKKLKIKIIVKYSHFSHSSFCLTSYNKYKNVLVFK